MSVRFLKGDLFRTPDLDGLAHGCNCAGAMGKGIAVEFRRRFPAMFREYKRRCQVGEFVLGDVFPWQESGLTIFNLGTQRTWRTRAELTAIEESLTEMVRLAAEMEVARIGLPRIGAGLGGLEWPAVKTVLARIGGEAPMELVVFETFEPAPDSLS